MSPEEDPLDRQLQSAELARIMAAAYPHPTLFLGYVVTFPHASRRMFFRSLVAASSLRLIIANPYEIMVRDGKVHDIDEEDLDRW